MVLMVLLGVAMVLLIVAMVFLGFVRWLLWCF